MPTPIYCRYFIQPHFQKIWTIPLTKTEPVPPLHRHRLQTPKLMVHLCVKNVQVYHREVTLKLPVSRISHFDIRCLANNVPGYWYIYLYNFSFSPTYLTANKQWSLCLQLFTSWSGLFFSSHHVFNQWLVTTWMQILDKYGMDMGHFEFESDFMSWRGQLNASDSFAMSCGVLRDAKVVFFKILAEECIS